MDGGVFENDQNVFCVQAYHKPLEYTLYASQVKLGPISEIKRFTSVRFIVNNE